MFARSSLDSTLTIGVQVTLLQHVCHPLALGGSLFPPWVVGNLIEKKIKQSKLGTPKRDAEILRFQKHPSARMAPFRSRPVAFTHALINAVMLAKHEHKASWHLILRIFWGMYGYPHGTQVHLDWYSTASESFARLRSARPCLRTCRWIRAPTPMSAAPSISGTPSATIEGPPALLQHVCHPLALGGTLFPPCNGRKFDWEKNQAVQAWNSQTGCWDFAISEASLGPHGSIPIPACGFHTRSHKCGNAR